MLNKNKESLAIGWCDNGLVDGKFAEGLVRVTLNAVNNGIHIAASLRVQGNQIGKQRQILFDHWADSTSVDWLLWIDSDISISIDIIKKLWDTADKVAKPIVSGVYFISKSTDDELMQPYPVIFNDIDKHTIQYIHPLPENEIIKIDSSGMGLVLMHRSIISKLRNKFPNQSVFAEENGVGKDFVSEDIAFFRKVKEVGIPVYAHTGAIAKHMKRFPLDSNYYGAYWNIQKS
jgi:hypothetical protein